MVLRATLNFMKRYVCAQQKSLLTNVENFQFTSGELFNMLPLKGRILNRPGVLNL